MKFCTSSRFIKTFAETGDWVAGNGQRHTPNRFPVSSMM